MLEESEHNHNTMETRGGVKKILIFQPANNVHVELHGITRLAHYPYFLEDVSKIFSTPVRVN